MMFDAIDQIMAKLFMNGVRAIFVFCNFKQYYQVNN